MSEVLNRFTWWCLKKECALVGKLETHTGLLCVCVCVCLKTQTQKALIHLSDLFWYDNGEDQPQGCTSESELYIH